MARFEVSSEMAPGAQRSGVGFFKPGKEMNWPDAACKGEKPSLRMIPLDAEAYELLVKAWGAEAVKAKYGESHFTAKPAPVEPKPEEKKIGKRQADR